MPATDQLTVTLPIEAIEFVRSKVASGEYASESDVLAESLHTLQTHQTSEPFASWLLDEVVPAYDAMKADPSRGLPASRIYAALEEERQTALKEA